MTMLRPYAALFRERRISSVTFTSVHLYGNVYMRVGLARALAALPLASATGHWRGPLASAADSSDFGLLGEQRFSKCVIPCLGRR